VKRMLWALTLEFYAVAVRQKTVRKFLGELYARYCSELAAVVREGIDRGEFRKVDTAQTAAAITGLCEGLILLWALEPNVFPFEKFFEASMRTMLDGMKPER